MSATRSHPSISGWMAISSTLGRLPLHMSLSKINTSPTRILFPWRGCHFVVLVMVGRYSVSQLCQKSCASACRSRHCLGRLKSVLSNFPGSWWLDGASTRKWSGVRLSTSVGSQDMCERATVGQRFHFSK